MHNQMLVAWLHDAHAMEARSLPILRRQAEDTRQRPEVRVRYESHVRETEQHVERVAQALRALGSEPLSVLAKSEALANLAKDITGRLFGDPLATMVIADVAAEQFEVAAYTALIAAAEHAAAPEVARLCRLNRGEDEDMAEWLDAQIPLIVAASLEQPRTVNR
jgi:ferritin-like metal-binding protein YciE